MPKVTDPSMIEPTISVMIEPATVSMDVAGQILGISGRMVEHLITRGDLPSIKIGHRRLVEPAAIREYVASLREQAAQ